MEQHGGEQRVEEHKSERQSRHFALRSARTWGEARSQAACRRELTGAQAAQVYARAALTHSRTRNVYGRGQRLRPRRGIFHATPPDAAASPEIFTRFAPFILRKCVAGYLRPIQRRPPLCRCVLNCRCQIQRAGICLYYYGDARRQTELLLFAELSFSLLLYLRRVRAYFSTFELSLENWDAAINTDVRWNSPVSWAWLL